MITRATLFERFAGRDAELQHLVELRARSSREARGGAVLVAGDAGVGKSRLLTEFEAATRPTSSVFVRVRCEELAVAYTPFVRALEELADRRELRASQEIATALAALTVSSAGPKSDGTERHRKQLEAINSAFAHAARRLGQLTLVIDDAHWSDRSSLEAMRAVASAARRLPLALVIAYRHDDLALDNARALAFAAIQREGVDRITLEPLSFGEIAGLLRNYIPNATSGVLRRIYELSEGKPYVAEELARSVVERGEEIELEPTLSLRSAVLERAARLSEESREIIGLAAVLGRNFTPSDLRALGATPEQLTAAFSAAMQLQLVEEREVGGMPWFRFRHALTREILYRAFLALERQALHRKIAEHLESVGTRTTELAYHLTAAGMNDRAVIANERAGDEAMGIAAFGDAGASYARGLGLAYDDLDAVARLGLKMAEALAAAGDLDETISSNERVAKHLERAERHDAALAIRLVTIRALAPTRIADASPLLERTNLALRPDTSGDLRFELELLNARILRVRGYIDEAVVACARAEAALPELTPQQRKALELSRAYNRTRVSDLASVERMLALRLQRIIAKESDPGAIEAERMSTAGIISFRRGEIRKAFEQCVESAERWERIGRKRAAIRSKSNAAFFAADLGDFAFVNQLSDECRREGLEPGEPLLAARIRLARATGADPEPYLEWFERALRTATEYMKYMLARDLPWMISHDRAAARSIVHRALDATPAGDLGGELAEAVVAFGDDADVERALERFGKTVVMPNDLKSSVEKLMVDARLAARLNRPLEAARHASSLATLTRTSGQWLLLAHALDLLGDFEGARAELERVGALAELARLEHRTKGGPGKAQPAKLTSREEQIARLVVAGLSSREAAERLAIAPRTVETHLANAYQKLRIGSRAELATYFESLAEPDG